MGEAGLGEAETMITNMGNQAAGMAFQSNEAQKAREDAAAQAQAMRDWEEKMTRAGWSREDIENAKKEKAAKTKMWLDLGVNALGTILDAVIPG